MLHKFADESSLFLAAAEYFTRIANESIRARGRFVVALSGGSTPQKLFHHLSKQPFSLAADQSKFFIFFSDERLVSLSSKDSNAGNAIRNWLADSDVPREQIFIADTSLTPELAATAYENEIRTVLNDDPVFDLIMLGMGADGHTASLFPGSPVTQAQRAMVAPVTSVAIPRLTFTPPLINAAHHRMFLIAGKDKSGTLKQVHDPAADPAQYPAALFADNADWFVCV